MKLKTDKDYEEAFREVFFEAVSCRLRSDGEVGIMMSGGMDSASIACVAAEKLKTLKKNLYAFTSIPIAKYKDKISKHIIADESNEVNLICNHLKNVDINFCRNEGKNSLTNVESFINTLEQPYKIFQTLDI